ncbi:hypothetical protein ASG31_08260 [Chryseobacterium sp. Leaf404]|uniref:hypothetical protein n=1 Tax=unclassified Chryseobacterium TaxID=2593645 RepID=UPI0006F4DB9E|nr:MULTISPECIES: hypothetical protein [unclassified Chryseobacterium]KQT17394.1 hypothetical protein ASG31_08260 [Chryseobacterium sp. Leaf404]
MYQFYNNTLTIPAKALYDDLGVISESNYKYLCSNGKLNKVVTARGLGNRALVEFDSIPERFRVQIVKILGYPPKKNTQNLILNFYKDDYEAVDFFAYYLLDDYRTLSTEKQEEYVKNAQMLQAVEQYVKETVSFVRSRNGKRGLTEIWKDAATAVTDVKDQIGHSLPKSSRRLKEKLEEFKKDGYSSLVSENFGNKKAVKVKDENQEALLRTLLRDHRTFDNEQIAVVYNAVAKIQQFPELSANTIGNYRKKWNLLVMAGTKGEKGFDNKIAMHVKRSAPTSPMLYWTVDGWDAELLYQKSATTLKGKNTTTYHNRLTMVVVLDPSVKYPVGYAIGTHENADLIKAALRNAVQHTEELFGAKHKVLQIQADNYAKKEMTSFYEIVSDKFTPAKVGNAKSKVIEPWFKHFNKTYCQLAPNWSGQGVKSKAQPNDEYLNKIRHSFPDQEGCMMQLVRMIELEREKLVDQYLQAYNEMPSDAKKQISQQEFLLHFGETTGFTNKLSHNGLHVAINGKKMEYDSFDINFRMNAHLNWTIKFDSNDLTQVLAHNEEQNISFLLDQKYVQPMALYDRQEGDGEELQRVRNFNKKAKEIVLETQAEDSKIVNQLFIQNPELDNTLAKMVIVDSRGQHKDQRNSKRLAPAKKLLEKQEQKAEKVHQQSWEKEQDDYYANKINLDKYLTDDE